MSAKRKPPPGPPRPDPLLNAVGAACAGRRWRRGARVLVAVSGGADSVALLALLREVNLRDRRGWRLTVAHLDHGLRGAAGRRDAAFVRGLARGWRVPCRVGRIDLVRRLRGSGDSREAAAREARYAFLRDAARATRSSVIATAHTLDDQAETVLFRILKGCGIRGLRGILPAQRLTSRPKCVLVRPLLGVSRESLRQWLKDHDITWREDATNANRAIPRNRLRHTILPQLRRHVNPSVAEALARLGGAARETHRWMRGSAKRWIKRCVTRAGSGYRFSAAAWRRMPQALRPEVALRLLRSCGAPRHPLTTSRLAAISRLSNETGPWPAVTCPGPVQISKAGLDLRFSPAPTRR